jgi:CelD/BcsL family acetyltransferase involved in cellulose biosynthesis
MKESFKPYNFEWITDWDTIYSQEFQEQWLKWHETAVNSHVFFHPGLCMAWLETYKAFRNLKPLFCIAKYEHTTVFLPLVLWKKNWKNAFQKMVIPVGYSDFDYHDPLIVTKNNKTISYVLFLENLLDELKSKIHFDKIDINGLKKGDSNLVFEEKDIAPYADISLFSDNEQYLNTLKTKLRGDLRRQIRRLSEQGTLSMVSRSASNILDVDLSEFLKQHSKRWPNAYKAPRFHENIFKFGLNKGVVHFSELKVNDEIISWHLGFMDDTTFYYYMPATNGRWQKYSPGKVHLLMLVNNAIELKLQVFDHLRGNENYKNGWAQNLQKLYKLEYHSKGLSSKIKKQLIGLKNKFL